MVVYIDVFFFVNFIMDLLILFAVRIITGSNAKIFRSILAAVVGATYGCLVLMLSSGGIIEGIITYIVMSSLMSIIAFGYKGVQNLVEKVTVVFFVTFLLSGIINQLYYREIIEGINGILMAGVIGVIVITVIFRIFRRKKITEQILVPVRIEKGGNVIEIKALVDTGNCLREPLSRKPVAVISKGIADRLQKGDDEGIFIIPYKSVGMERGMLEGFMADYMVITKAKENGECYKKIVKPILAKYDGKFTENNHYQMLLHPEMMGEGEDYV